MKQPLPEKTIFFESDDAISYEAGSQIQKMIEKRFPGWTSIFMDDGIRLAAVHGPALPLEDWVDEVGSRQLMEDLKLHANSAQRSDFPRLAMGSFRQWINEQNEKGGRKR